MIKTTFNPNADEAQSSGPKWLLYRRVVKAAKADQPALPRAADAEEFVSCRRHGDGQTILREADAVGYSNPV